MEIINSVQSVDLKIKLDVKRIGEAFPTAYKPEKFPGTVLKLKEPKVAFLIFPSGKVICSGSKSIQAGKIAFEKLIKGLREHGLYEGEDPEITVQNLVAMHKFNQRIDIEQLFDTENLIYEPEMFPGAIYRINEPKASFLIFANGYIICSGCKTLEDVNLALKNLEEFLKGKGVIY